MKREAKLVDGTPSKRLFWSIMSDYSLRTALCELIDNALDIWLKSGKVNFLTIDIILETDRQLIRIKDNAGGVPEDQLDLLISPGTSDNNPDENIIGIFGVGSKRAVVALAEEIRIVTRHKDFDPYQIDIDKVWLSNDSWEMPVYKSEEEVDENTTLIDLSKLRIQLTTEDEFELFTHLSETYSNFLKSTNFDISINGTSLEPIDFDIWAYPPEYQPRYYQFNLPTSDGDQVGVEITAGLVREKEPGKEDYGVYFYCNERLIVKEVKDREVGYVTKMAGVPHSDASLARIIVKLYGPARLMPWNSSKSAINYAHHIFRGLQNFLIPVVSDYSSLSRRLKGQWEEKVFAFPEGEMEYIDINDVEKARRSFLPPLPKVRKHAIDRLRSKNRTIVDEKPWTLGLLEAIAAVDLIVKQKLETKNRIALILLDSSFEIALKEYIVHNEGFSYGGRTLEQIFKRRDDVIAIITQKIHIDAPILNKIRHYYALRNKLIHERATVDISDTDVSNYSATIQNVLNILFDLSF